MASTTATHQRSASATINPSTLIESCHVYPNVLLVNNSNNTNHTGGRGGTSPNNSQNKQRTTSHTRPSQTESDNASSTEDSQLPVCFCEKRHVQPIEGIKCITQSWRMKERMKTVSVALVMCLNLGVDPPDVMKIQPCANMECWIDLSAVSQQKALDLIGANLQQQYERWQPRARYKQSLDPTVEDVKKLCTSLRRNAKDERVLFHYNGHGVPRPTNNGEIWVFNRSYTQYIPLSIYDLQTWMGAPSIYVYDCSNAGIIVNAFNNFAENHELETEQQVTNPKSSVMGGPGEGAAAAPIPKISYKNCIQLAACASNQILPMNPQLPADLFTACLTTPIKIALKWWTLQKTSNLVPDVTYELIESIPGQLNDRRTMLGELNWIFAAITDTIAWNTLPRDLFQKLFRQDLLVASLFRNFLLAERILRSYDCTPISHPPLPQGYRHPMWIAWDLALDLALSQLPRIVNNDEPFQHSPFFEEQLTAFEVWLDRGCEERNPPEQLPIVLQVLLSQVHRLRALELLGRFLDLGPWAVNLALSVGIFPYVLKLLQSSAKELRPFLVFIWAKILAVDCTCQVDLVRDQGHKYFLSVLQDPTISAEYRTQSAFVLACIVSNYDVGQKCALQGSLVSICLDQLNDSNWRLRQWLTICLGQLWQNYDKARWSGYRDMAPDKLHQLLTDPIAEVRAAAVYALGTFISSGVRSEHADNIDRPIAMTLLSTVLYDMSPMVRMELVAALQWMVIIFKKNFVSVYLQDPSLHSLSGSMSPSGGSTSGSSTLPMKYHSLERTQTPMKKVSSSNSIMTIATPHTPAAGGTLRIGSLYLKLWQGITMLSRDPYPQVARAAQNIMEVVRNAAVELIAATEALGSSCTGGLSNSPNSNSVSLPPSPNTRTLYISHARDHHHHHKEKSGTSTDNTDGGAGGDSESMNASTTSTESQKQMPAGPPIVVTGYIPWAVSQFARPSKFSRIGFTNLGEGGLPEDGDETDATALSGAAASNVPIVKVSVPVPRARLMDQRMEMGMEWTEDQTEDRDAPEYLERERRFKRNERLRNEARDQQRRVPFIRMETQTFYYKTQQVPTLVKLHAYEPQIAVAYRDRVVIHDWGTGAMYSYIPETVRTFYQNNKFITRLSHQHSHQSPTNQQQIRVSSLEFVNAHDRSLILVGYDDGSLRLWRPPKEKGEEPRLISAWAALDMDQSFYLSNGGTSNSVGSVSGSGKSVSSTNLHASLTNLNAAAMPAPSSGIALNAGQKVPNGMVLTWQQMDQKIVVGGDSKYLRIWDAEREMKFCDLPLNADSAVKTLSSSLDGLIAAGFKDGSVRLFDKRCSPADSKLMTFRDHMGGTILAACIRNDCESLISGCSQGTIRSYDIRMKQALHSFQTIGDVTAISIHTMSDVVACGNQTIVIYGMDGKNLGTIRNHEGFMSNRIGQTSCLSFHPHKVSLACGFVDQTAAVFTVDGRK